MTDKKITTKTDKSNTQAERAELKGDVFLAIENRSFARAQIELLTAIKATGSISKAAKQVGISYKTAWDRVDAMNNMSSQPLVNRSAGGTSGGGTSLTEHGQSILTGFDLLLAEHQQFIEQLAGKINSLADVAGFIKSENMKTSARNQYKGVITDITLGAVNAEIVLDIGAEQPIIAVITKDSVTHLKLTLGSSVIALVKASSVLISQDLSIATSARNQLRGQVSLINKGAVNTDLTLDLGSGKSVSAVITNTSLDVLKLKTGEPACALFKASSVILMQG
ncbi:TOBE domain-containing protein [Catenovulum sp. 2E275]|uniref:TOBE domain-containing protein n=1 Tax=Catenovulum sp. 2E275 TaxID=2980497 RepID=UPI0021CF46DD|nr:TOBE domain-containing protein [Catenovulum sp. 2E275]MCU4677676.1 TOBE domain-containing protein [Catenovulum sp. 2E275]